MLQILQPARVRRGHTENDTGNRHRESAPGIGTRYPLPVSIPGIVRPMPSPLGHGLAAVAVGWTVGEPARTREALLMQTALLVAIGSAADLDLLISRHSQETHSIGAAAIVATLAAWWRWPIATSRVRTWMATFCAWMTHPMLDMLASDQSAPIGVMVLWPLSREHHQAGLDIFLAIWRRWESADFLAHNLQALVREVVLLGPIAWAVWWFRVRRRQYR